MFVAEALFQVENCFDLNLPSNAWHALEGPPRIHGRAVKDQRLGP